MTLTPEQKQQVSAWVAAGDSLAVIQRKISDEFKTSLTYMDVRFLVDDLGLELKNATPKADPNADLTKVQPARPTAPGKPAEKKAGLFDKLKKAVGAGDTAGAGEDLPAEELEDELPEDSLDDLPAGAGSAKVELDVVMRPGMVVSGTVSFSDGVSGKWALDQYGRLTLDTGKPGYQPAPADVQAFQQELSRQLQKKGY